MLGMHSDMLVKLVCEDFSSVEMHYIAYLSLSSSAINTIPHQWQYNIGDK